MNNDLRLVAALVICNVGLAVICRAAPGSITGRILDQTTRDGIPGAVVAIANSDIGANTAIDGRYAIRNVEPGYYNVRISMMSYKTILESRVLVRSSSPTVLDVELEPSPIQMKGVVVRPSYFEQAKDAPTSSQRMDFEEIIAQPGGSWDVQRAVQALPAVVSGTDQNNEIIVRGGNYGENLFVIDNIEVQNPNHFAWQGTGGGPVTMINTDYVRQVDFYAGAFPAKYGDKASSVLDIKYREGLADRIHAKLDVGMAGAGINLEGPVGNGSFMISGHRSFLSLIAGSFGLTAVPHYYDVQGKAVYGLTPRLKLSVLGIYGNDWIDIEPSGDMDQESNEIVKARSRQYAGGGTLHAMLGRCYAGLTLFRTKNHWYQYVTDTLSTELWKNVSTEIDNGAKLDATVQLWGGAELASGLFVKRPEGYFATWMKPDTLYLYQPGTDSIIGTTGYVTTYRIDNQQRTWKYGGYLQYKHNWGAFLTSNAGIRYDRHRLTGRGYVSPRLGLSFHLDQGTNINLALGRSYQSPEWFELAMDRANCRLSSKYTDQAVVGLERLLADDLRGTLEAYYKKYYHVPVPLSMTTADPNDWSSVYVNQGTGYAKGVELFLQKKVKDNLWGTASYSYSVSRARDPRDASKEFNWDFDYRHVLTLIAGYRRDFRTWGWYRTLRTRAWYKAANWLPLLPTDESEVSLKWRHLGGRPTTPQAYHPEWRRWTVDPGQAINSARLDPYQRLDIHIQKRWFFGRMNLLSYVDLQNLLSAKNVWTSIYNDDGTVSTVYQFGFMLVGGVVFEF